MCEYQVLHGQKNEEREEEEVKKYRQKVNKPWLVDYNDHEIKDQHNHVLMNM